MLLFKFIALKFIKFDVHVIGWLFDIFMILSCDRFLNFKDSCQKMQSLL